MPSPIHPDASDRAPGAGARSRIDEIDGIRGWAALVVLAFHLIWEIYGEKHPELRSPSLRLVLDGPLAVYVFFVLSGDALASGALRSQDSGTLTRMVVKRYFRLAGPILASSILVWALMASGLTFNTEAARVVGREDWLGTMLAFEPRLRDAASYGTFSVFVSHEHDRAYNPFMWPMAIELIGSLLVFCWLFARPALRSPAASVIVIAATLALMGSWYSLFFIGIGLALLREAGYLDRMRECRYATILSALGIVLVVVVHSLQDAQSYPSPRYSIALACALVVCLYINPFTTRLMRCRASRWLGRVSFPLYVTHIAVLVSFTSWWVLWTASSTYPIRDALLGCAASALIALAIAEGAARLEARYLGWLDRTVRTRLLR